VFSQK